MKKNLARCFSKNALASWPIWKTLISGAVALVIVAGSATGAVAGYTASVAASEAAAAQAEAEAEAAAAAEAARIAFEEQVRESWKDIDLTACAIVPAGKVGTEETQMDLSSSQQQIGVDLYTVNSVTGKRTPLTGKDVTITLTCKSLTKIENSDNKFDNDACKEGAASTYKLDSATGSVLIKKINPGEYTVTASCKDTSYIMPSAQKITVKEKVSYKKVEVKVQTQTAATAAEDTNISTGGGVETTIAVSTNTTGKGYNITDTKTWDNNGAKYLYYKDGTRSAYKVETTAATDNEGKSIQILSKAVFDADVQKQLDAAAASSASSASASAAMAAPSTVASASAAGVIRQGSMVTALNTQSGLRLMQLTESSPASSAPSAPVDTPAPASEAPTAAPTDTPAPATEAPTSAPAATDTPAPTEAASASPSPTSTPTASASASPAPTATTAVSTRPAYASESSYELFSASSGSYVDRSSVFSLPAGTTIVISGSSTGTAGQVNGIDVSRYQGNIDWNAVKASGISYVIIRCGYRGYVSGAIVKDPMFTSYIKGAKAAGLRVGVYFFSQAVNEQEAVEEASACLSAVSGYGLNYPIYIDIETSGGNGSGRADGLNKAERTAIAVAFCETVRNSGYSSGVYASRTWFNSRLNFATVSQYSIWNAYWPSAGISAGPGLSCNMWQYTSKGTVAGISGRVDLNVSYMG